MADAGPWDKVYAAWKKQETMVKTGGYRKDKDDQKKKKKQFSAENVFYQMEDTPILPDPKTILVSMFGGYLGDMIQSRLIMLASSGKEFNLKTQMARRFPPKYPNATKGTFDGHPFAIKDKMPELDRPWLTKMTKVEMTGPCVACHTKAGKFNCGQCYAVKFCSPECQKKLWKEHKEECTGVIAITEQLKDGINDIGRAFGVPANAADREEALAKLMWGVNWNPRNEKRRELFWGYCIPRALLVDVYLHIGFKRRSIMAFRLASENNIDIQRLMEHAVYSMDSKDKEKSGVSYYAGIPDKHNAYFASHMIAGDMDQAALDFLIRLRLSKATEEERSEERGDAKRGAKGGGITKGTIEYFHKVSKDNPDPFFVPSHLILPFFKFDPDKVHYDIEGTDYFDLFEMPLSFHDWEFTVGKDQGAGIPGLPLPPGGQRGFWYMMLSIIKYKKLQKLLWEKRVLQAEEHTKDGALYTSKSSELNRRIVSLKCQVEHLLGLAESMHACYFRRDQFYQPWKMCHTYTNILSGYKARGRKVMDVTMMPVVDWNHLAFDVDPSQDLNTHPELKEEKCKEEKK